MAAPAASTKRPQIRERATAESEQTDRTTPPSSAILSAFTGIRRVPTPVNEPVKTYAPGSPEKKSLKDRLKRMAKERVEIPLIIGGQEIRSGETGQSVMPHDHRHVLADWHKASPKHVEQAIAAAKRAQADWANWPWEDRAAVFIDSSVAAIQNDDGRMRAAVRREEKRPHDALRADWMSCDARARHMPRKRQFSAYSVGTRRLELNELGLHDGAGRRHPTLPRQ